MARQPPLGDLRKTSRLSSQILENTGGAQSRERCKNTQAMWGKHQLCGYEVHGATMERSIDSVLCAANKSKWEHVPSMECKHISHTQEGCALPSKYPTHHLIFFSDL